VHKPYIFNPAQIIFKYHCIIQPNWLGKGDCSSSYDIGNGILGGQAYDYPCKAGRSQKACSNVSHRFKLKKKEDKSKEIYAGISNSAGYCNFGFD